VERLRGFVDGLWEQAERVGKDRESVEVLWRRVLDVEQVFWPQV
jgi:hypothetical protein